MANTQSWRLHITKSRQPLLDQNIDSTLSDLRPDITVMSTSPENEPFKSRPRVRRGISSFTTYVNSHTRAAAPSEDAKIPLPFLDWVNLKGDDACNPDVGSMCDAIRQQLLSKPSDQLPASFNGPLLHIIEAYEGLLQECNCLREVRQAQGGHSRETIDHHERLLGNYMVGKHSSHYETLPAQMRYPDSGQYIEGLATSTAFPSISVPKDKRSISSSAIVDEIRILHSKSRHVEAVDAPGRVDSGNPADLGKQPEPASTNINLPIFDARPDSLKPEYCPSPPRRHTDTHGRGHRRDFSFQPGDDAKSQGQPGDESRKTGIKEEAVQRKVKKVDSLLHFSGLTRALEMELLDDKPPEHGHLLTKNPSGTSSSFRQDTLKFEHHMVSEHQASRRSTSSYDSSDNSTSRRTDRPQHRSLNSDFAIAAARAAKKKIALQVPGRLLRVADLDTKANRLGMDESSRTNPLSMT